MKNKTSNRIMNLCTKEFLEIFKQELISVFNKEDRPVTEDDTYWGFYSQVESTMGWSNAFKIACEKHPHIDMGKGLLNYYMRCDCDDFDTFCHDMSKRMIKLGVIEEGLNDGYIDYQSDWIEGLDWIWKETARGQGWKSYTKDIIL